MRLSLMIPDFKIFNSAWPRSNPRPIGDLMMSYLRPVITDTPHTIALSIHVRGTRSEPPIPNLAFR